MQRSANEEAIRHLTAALELLQTLPETHERIQQELSLQIALGVPLQAMKGPAASEVERVYARARELCQQLGDAPQLVPVLAGLWAFYLLRGKLGTTHELAEQILALARDVEAPALLLHAYRIVGTSLLFRGELTAAQASLEQALTLYDPQQHRSHAFLYYGLDPGVICLSFGALASWLLGYPDQALEKSHKALTLAQELAHPMSLAFVLSFAASLHGFRVEPQATQGCAETLIALSNERGLPLWETQGSIHLGWAWTEQERIGEGIAQMRQGLTTRRGLGVRLAETLYLAWLAEAQGKAGQVEEGLATLAAAMEAVDETRERINEAELYRLKGELTMKKEVSGFKFQVSSLEEEAEECFHKAIEIARRQGAKSLELRAVMSLARLWQKQGKKEDARQMLAEIYGWFTEGFDTADLKEAKALLEELS
jgi:predicted ATPase